MEEKKEAIRYETFVGPVFMYATAQDWARFGLLYLHDGFWGAKQVLPPGWVDYSRQIRALSGDRSYAAGFWGISAAEAAEYHIPKDRYVAAGFLDQMVFIIPSLDMVVVRMGWTNEDDWDKFDFLQRILSVEINYRE